MDLIFNGIKGEDINKVISSYPSNVFQSNKTQIQNEKTYSIIFEIKKMYMKQLKKYDIKKQITKYQKILHLLCLQPELKEIRNRLKISNENKLIFSLVTNGEYKNFFNRKLLIDQKKKFKNDNLSDLEIKKSKNSFEEIMDSFDKIEIPVLIFFVPSLYQSELIENQQKTIASMEKILKEQNEIIKKQDKKLLEMQKNQDDMEKEMKKKKDELKKEMEKEMQKMIDELKKELVSQKIIMEKEKEEYMNSIKEKELNNQKK